MATGKGERPDSLRRSIPVVPAAAIVLANVVGTGVFVKARVMTCNVGDPQLVMFVWVLAGLLSLAGAMVYAELATLMPRAGGEFNFIGAAYGPLWAFLFGWTRTLAIGASAAAIAIVFVVFLNDLLGASLSPVWLAGLPVAAIAVATALNYASARANGFAATLLTAVKVGLVLFVGLGAFVHGHGDWGHFAQGGAMGSCDGVPGSSRFGVAGFGAAMLGALWAYNGWNIIAMLGSEVRDPARTLPRALIGGTVVVMVLYVCANAAYFYVLTPAEIASLPESSSVAFETAARFAGSGVAALLSAGLMISAYGTLHSTILSASRLPYALSTQDMLPIGLRTLSARGVPVVAVIVMGIWSSVLALSGTFDILTDIYVFVLWIFYAMAGLSLFVLRRRHPDAHRPYRVWGYPIVPLAYVAVAAWLLVNTLVATPGRAASGLLLVASGVPVYAWFARRRAGGPERGFMDEPGGGGA